MENSKDKLQLTVRREVAAPASGGAGPGRSTPLVGAGAAAVGSHLGRAADLNPYDPSGGPGGGAGPCSGVPPPLAGHPKEMGGANAVAHFSNYSDNRPNYCNQNLYVQPPTRGGSIDYRNPMTPQPPLPHSPYDDKASGRMPAGSRSRDREWSRRGRC